LEAPQRDPGSYQLVDGLQRGRKVRGVELRELVPGVSQATDEQETPHLDVPRVRGVDAVAMRFECRASRLERLHRPVQIARRERNLGFGNQAPCASYGFSRPEGASGTSQKSPGPGQVAQLRHGDSAKRQRGRVVAQGNPVQGAQGIAGGQRTRRSCDQRIHADPAHRGFWNPATLVTPGISRFRAKLIS
jgi:hypothetical protein